MVAAEPAHLPETQDVHVERPVVAAALPTAHERQLPSAPVEYLPDSQSVQPLDEGVLNLPVPQSEHELAPSPLNLPPRHVKQSDDPSNEALPAAQLVHSVTPLLLLNVPAAHCSQPKAALFK